MQCPAVAKRSSPISVPEQEARLGCEPYCWSAQSGAASLRADCRDWSKVQLGETMEYVREREL